MSVTEGDRSSTRFNEETTMQLRTIAIISVGLSAAIMMPLEAAQPALAAAAQQRVHEIDRPPPTTVAKPPTQVVPRGPRRDLEPVHGSVSRPVITEPAATTDMCCVSDMGWKMVASSEFDIRGEGVPGHQVKVNVTLDNGGSRSRVANKQATVGEDGIWQVRWIEVSTEDLKSGSFIEINALQVFPATRVREDDREVAALPVYLRYRVPSRRNGGAAVRGGG